MAPSTDQLKNISTYSDQDQLMILSDLCHKIYIARNITLDTKTINDMLSRIDKLFRDNENFN